MCMSIADAELKMPDPPKDIDSWWRSNQKQKSTLTEFQDDNLVEKLSSGLYGGLPLEGPVALAFCSLLRRLDWQFEPRELAGAMLHFPEQFGVNELRTILFRLGFEAIELKSSGEKLSEIPDTSLILDKRGGIFLRSALDDEDTSLIDLETKKHVSPSRWQSYTCLVFSKQDLTAPKVANKSWLGDASARFAPEIRNLLFLMLASNTIVIIASLSTIKIFDTVLPSRALDTLIGVCAGLAILLALEFRLRQIRAHLIARMAGRIEYLLGTALFSKLVGMPLTMLTANSVNDQVGRLKQFETVRDFFSGPVVAVLLELPFTFLLLGIVFYISPVLGLMTFGLISLYLLITIIMYPKLKRASRLMAAAHQDHAKFLLETFEHRSQIARMGIGAIWRQRLRPKTRRLVEARANLDTINRTFSTLAGSTTPLCAAITILIGAGMVIEGTISGGQLIGVTMLSSRLFAPIQQAAISLVRAPELANLFRQVDSMMQIDTGEKTHHRAVSRSIEPTIVFDNVSMRYPKTQNPALSGISFSVEAGELIAITGHSGAGKSSLLRVILGLYPIQAGTIGLGQINLNQLARNEITKNVAYVGDRPILIHGTIAQNLLILTPGRNIEDLINITKELGILDWIEELPDGFKTRLDHDQLARIPPGIQALLSTAQALLSNPPILLLDETMSGLTPENEQKLLKVILARRGSLTTLIVTQRPSHHKLCDRVFSMNKGRIEISSPNQQP